MVMLINAVFGAGSIAGPLILGLLHPGGYRSVFMAAAVVAVIIFPLILRIPTAEVNAAHSISGSRIGLIVAFVTLFFLYNGVEIGVASWAPTHLLANGAPAALAASVTGLFYATYTLGRFLAAPVALKVRAPHLVLGGFILVLPAMVLAT